MNVKYLIRLTTKVAKFAPAPLQYLPSGVIRELHRSLRRETDSIQSTSRGGWLLCGMGRPIAFTAAKPSERRTADLGCSRRQNRG